MRYIGINTFILNINDLSPGIFLFQLADGLDTRVIKVIKE
ncbi:hypothetical protein LBMAG25_19030 [Bacteroidota bacterium]|nr:hypothetical protein LBMAG25_19030 [Bacteroidota bacterium]